MKREASRMVRAGEVALPNLDISEFARVVIAQAPAEPPCGAYDVGFEGRTIEVSKTTEGWIAGQV